MYVYNYSVYKHDKMMSSWLLQENKKKKNAYFGSNKQLL